MYLVITVRGTSQTTPRVRKDSLVLQKTRLALMMQKTKKMNSMVAEATMSLKKEKRVKARTFRLENAPSVIPNQVGLLN